MKTINLLAILLLASGGFTGYYLLKDKTISQETTFTTVISDSNNLRLEILKTIKVPFTNYDTVVIIHSWMLCGNSAPEEIPLTFNLKFDKEPYIHLLSSTLKSVVINSQQHTNLLFSNKHLTIDMLDDFNSNTVTAIINAEISTVNNREILVHETYQLNKEIKTVNKFFFVDKKTGMWQYE